MTTPIKRTLQHAKQIDLVLFSGGVSSSAILIDLLHNSTNPVVALYVDRKVDNQDYKKRIQVEQQVTKKIERNDWLFVDYLINTDQHYQFDDLDLSLFAFAFSIGINDNIRVHWCTDANKWKKIDKQKADNVSNAIDAVYDFNVAGKNHTTKKQQQVVDQFMEKQQ